PRSPTRAVKPWTRQSPGSCRQRRANPRSVRSTGSRSSGAFACDERGYSGIGASGREPMPYDLDQFVSDCRAILKRDPGPTGREHVRIALERLLANKEFVEEYCGDKVPRGLKLLYEDPDLGFQVLAHINDKARVSPPHDHGASWAIYGQATHYTDMIEWERE